MPPPYPPLTGWQSYMYILAVVRSRFIVKRRGIAWTGRTVETDPHPVYISIIISYRSRYYPSYLYLKKNRISVYDLAFWYSHSGYVRPGGADLGRGGSKTESADRVLPLVKLKKSGRKFQAKGFGISANCLFSGQIGMNALKTGRPRRVVKIYKGGKGDVMGLEGGVR